MFCGSKLGVLVNFAYSCLLSKCQTIGVTGAVLDNKGLVLYFEMK